MSRTRMSQSGLVRSPKPRNTRHVSHVLWYQSQLLCQKTRNVERVMGYCCESVGYGGPAQRTCMFNVDCHVEHKIVLFF